MKYIELHGGHRALVDDEDYDYLNQFSWRVHLGYAIRSYRENGKSKTISMHIEIMRTPKGFVTDHINEDRLDNRRINLRIATRLQNSQWTKKTPSNNTKFKGIIRQGKGWKTRFQFNGKRVVISSFPNEHLAALAYDLWATDVFGEFAKTNFKSI